jgi:hypothetical protein
MPCEVECRFLQTRDKTRQIVEKNMVNSRHRDVLYDGYNCKYEQQITLSDKVVY